MKNKFPYDGLKQWFSDYGWQKVLNFPPEEKLGRQGSKFLCPFFNLSNFILFIVHVGFSTKISLEDRIPLFTNSELRAMSYI